MKLGNDFGNRLPITYKYSKLKEKKMCLTLKEFILTFLLQKINKNHFLPPSSFLLENIAIIVNLENRSGISHERRNKLTFRAIDVNFFLRNK